MSVVKQHETTVSYAGPAKPWAESADGVLASLSVDPRKGLDDSEVTSRRARFGRNQLHAAAPRTLWAIVADQFNNIVVILLAVAAALAFAFGEYIEGLAIFTVIVINGAIGFLTEWRATRSMEALSRMGQVSTLVVRGGETLEVGADQLVPGDIVVLEGGNIVSADIRLLEAAKLQADESSLTGESLPIRKGTEKLDPATRLMERSNMVFKGTALTRGSGRGVVVGTGRNTELGRISNLVFSAQAQETPLEKKLDALGGRLAWAVVALAALIAVTGIVAGRELFLAVEVAIALAVAAIPEGLPIVATIALARGMWRMARRNAVIARLSAVETLGATNVILTDKTGTLTENRMAVAAAWIDGEEWVRDESGRLVRQAGGADDRAGAVLESALEAAALCANASVRRDDGEIVSIGDPTEVALLMAALEHGIERAPLLERMPELAEVAFDPDLKLMATVHQRDGGVLFAVKGAPESVIPKAASWRSAAGVQPIDDINRQTWLDQARLLGNRGLRTIAVATRAGSNQSEEAYADLDLLAIFGLEDPPRRGVRDAVQSCRSAGVSVVMVTGDHAATARNIAEEIGIVGEQGDCGQFIDGAMLDDWLSTTSDGDLRKARVFSRVSPEQKLKLISRYQQAGNVIAMTGDGVNDAPALKQADIGVAMGLRGTDVAREAAAMVLRNDEFGTIVEAIAQGRTIFANIRKFAVYLLSCNISEVMIVAVATVAGAPLPLLPLQILFLNLVTDVFPALALGVGEGPPELMRKRPRPPTEPVLTRVHWLRIVIHGLVMCATVLGAMAVAHFHLGFDVQRATTVSFCTLAFAQLWHVFNMRDDIGRVLRNEVTRNGWIWAAIALCTALILAAIYTPLPSAVLDLQSPGTAGWAVILAMSLVPLIAAPLVRPLARRLVQIISANSR